MQYYRPEIDGLRCLAVLGVVFYHFNLFGFRGGFLGVDVFFAISGYLIGGILFDEVARTGALSFSKFWLRRARRILPALFCMLAVSCLFVGPLLTGTTLMPGYARSLLTSIVSSSNFLFFSESGYFDTQALNKPLLHTWSLAVEEQFYVLLPLFVYTCLILCKTGRRLFLCVLLASVFASCAACLSMRAGSESFAFFMLPTRLWEPLAGCALAYAAREGLLPELPQRLRAWLEIAAAVLLVGCLRYAPHGMGLWNTFAVLSTLLLLHSRQGPISWLLSTRPFVRVGKISYSLYLWHWPIFVLATLYWLRISKSYKISLLLLSFLCAYLSYRYVEQPFRRNHIVWRHIGRRLLPVSVGLCVIALTALWLPRASTFQLPDEPLFNAYRSAAQIDQDEVPLVNGSSRVRFLAFGDSHAGCMATALVEQAKAYGVNGAVISSIGIFPHPDYQQAATFSEYATTVRSIHAYIARHRIKTLLLIGRWSGFIFGQTTKARYKMAYRNEPTRDTRAIFTRTMTEALKAWLDAGVSVYILEQVPEHDYDSLERAALVRSAGPAEEYASRLDFLRDLVRDIGHPRLHLLRTEEAFRNGDEFFFVQDGKILYADYNHINLFGARLLKGVLDPFFAHIRAEGP